MYEGKILHVSVLWDRSTEWLFLYKFLDTFPFPDFNDTLNFVVPTLFIEFVFLQNNFMKMYIVISPAVLLTVETSHLFFGPGN